MTAVSMAQPVRPGRRRLGRITLHVFLIVTCLVWLLPLAWAVFTSLRPFEETFLDGYVSFPKTLNFENYFQAWTQVDLGQYYLNTLVVVIPAVIVTLTLASMAAFSLSRSLGRRMNVLLLIMFTAGNLLPPQVVITPLYRLYLALPLPDVLTDNGVWYDQTFGIIAIHIAFQVGFCIFVLTNYMRTISNDLIEAAVMDGASILRIWRSVITPLTAPALAALATLQFTWIYNDFFWAIVLMRTGVKLPITSALNSFTGEWFSDNNLVAAGAVLVALPTILVFVLLQRYFVGGLTLGSSKG
jgi:multiple sugar transport system permease protein